MTMAMSAEARERCDELWEKMKPEVSRWAEEWKKNKEEIRTHRLQQSAGDEPKTEKGE
jgi:hypothetical protein